MRITLIALGFILVLFSKQSLAQANLAKLKYEEAEKAYEDGKYNECITLLEETEKILKQTSPKTLFLKIQAGNNITIKDFKFLSSLRANCSYYLEKYDQTEDVERYKEVYEISKSLNRYPLNLEEWSVLKNEKSKAAKKDSLIVENALKSKEDQFKRLSFFPLGSVGVNLGFSKSNVNDIFLSTSKNFVYNGKLFQAYTRKDKYLTGKPEITQIVINNDGMVCEIERILIFKTRNDLRGRFNQIKDSIKLVFGNVKLIDYEPYGEIRGYHIYPPMVEESIALFRDENIYFGVSIQKIKDGKNVYFSLKEIRGYPDPINIINCDFKYESGEFDQNLVNLSKVDSTKYIMKGLKSLSGSNLSFSSEYIKTKNNDPNTYMKLTSGKVVSDEYLHIKDDSTVYYFSETNKLILKRVSNFSNKSTNPLWRSRGHRIQMEQLNTNLEKYQTWANNYYSKDTVRRNGILGLLLIGVLSYLVITLTN